MTVSLFYALAGFFVLYIAYKIAFAPKEPTPMDNRVTYYSGYPKLGPIQEGRLLLEEDAVVFKTRDLEKEYFRIPYKNITQVEVEKQELSKSQLRGFSYANLTGMTPSLMFGRSDSLFISYIDNSSQELRINFVQKTDCAERLKSLIESHRKV